MSYIRRLKLEMERRAELGLPSDIQSIARERGLGGGPPERSRDPCEREEPGHAAAMGFHPEFEKYHKQPQPLGRPPPGSYAGKALARL